MLKLLSSLPLILANYFRAPWNKTFPPKTRLTVSSSLCCKSNRSWLTGDLCIPLSKQLHYLYPERQLLLLCFRIWGERTAKAAKLLQCVSDTEKIVRLCAGIALHYTFLRGAHGQMLNAILSFAAHSPFIR